MERHGSGRSWPGCSRCSRPAADGARRRRWAFDEFDGIVTCDRAKMYWQVGRLQWCWWHLRRDFQAMIDTGKPPSSGLESVCRAATCELFEHWADCAPEGFRGPHWCVGWVRFAGRSSVCSCAECKATIAMYAVRVGSCTSIASGCGRCSASRRGRADKQCGRAFVASCGDMAEALVRNAERGRQPFRRDDVDRDRNLPPTASQRL